jgi:glycosyltransferase involved in cell wall biosynthesis
LLASSLDDWRETLESLIADAELRRRLSTAGRETVAARYTVERIGPLLAEGLAQAAS